MKTNQGFTLMELITVMCIIGIMAAMGMPTIHNWILNQRVNTAARSIAGALQVARVNAIKQRSEVVVEFYAGTGSQAMVRVFIDDGGGVIANAGNKIYDSGEKILNRVVIADRVTLTDVGFGGNTFVGHTATAIAYFDTLGLTIASRGSVVVKNDIGTQKKIVLNPVGNSRIENI